MSHIETIHHEGFDPEMKQVYVPAIRVVEGRLVFISGITAAPPYHHHPHRPEEFDSIPTDIEGQVERLFRHLDLALEAAGCRRSDIVVLNRFFTNVRADQDVVNAYQGRWFGGHIPTSTSVEVKSLATDPRLRLEISAIAVAPPA
ncbi:MAG: RidA family protein [Actinomycetes bacterium]|mgnify:FL=1|nr:RidA family protein [Acidimicrobiia bacterium]